VLTFNDRFNLRPTVELHSEGVKITPNGRTYSLAELFAAFDEALGQITCLTHTMEFMQADLQRLTTLLGEDKIIKQDHEQLLTRVKALKAIKADNNKYKIRRTIIRY